jgi:hypothetical protein
MNMNMTMPASSDLPMSSAPQPSNPMGMEAAEEPSEASLQMGDSSTPGQNLRSKVFEDFFPKLDLTEEQEKDLAEWFARDLKQCVRAINSSSTGMSWKERWAIWRATFMLEYVEKFYPTMSLGPDFKSGVLCDKVLDGMNRLKKAVFSPRPFFCVDDRVSGIMDIETIHRLEWYLHTVMDRDINIRKAIGMEGLFEFLLDGSLIVEVDQMYESIPQRTLQTYLPNQIEKLEADAEDILDQEQFNEAMLKLQSGLPARCLVEKKVETKNGLQVFLVDKQDHLIPGGVYRDEDIRFRGRRMYLTRGDLELLASDDVQWYDKKKVDKVLDHRRTLRSARHFSRTGDKATVEAAQETLNKSAQNPELCFDWGRTDSESLTASLQDVPYTDTWAIYRVTCRYGYKTKSDPKGVLPKWCVFDFDPESMTLLRANVYPHFHELPNYYHFKLGYAPKSYYGFGFGQRLINEDMLESNAVGLFIEGSALATCKPFLCVSPEFDALVPFDDGFGPGKIGYVRNVNDFKEVPITAPPSALIQMLIPLVQNRAENRTGVTALVQGRTEDSDPRSPASKTQMLLNQALVSIESIVEDWSKSGWEPLARFIWKALYERAVYENKGESLGNVIDFGGEVPDLEHTRDMTLQELSQDVYWRSQASSEYINSSYREQQFLRQFQFFSPLLQQLATLNPPLYKKYFMRWLQQAGRELQIRGFRHLIPTEKELESMPVEALQGMATGMTDLLKSGGLNPQNMPSEAPGGVE